MAFNSMLRRACSSVLPLAIRSAGSRRTLHSAISAVLCVEKGSLGGEICRQSFLPLSQFSTTTVLRRNADENLIQVLESEIDCAEKPKEIRKTSQNLFTCNDPKQVEDIPHGFPFEIIDNPGERTILLKRTYQDETIEVEVDAPSGSAVEDEDEDDDEKKEGDDMPPSIPLVISISKGSGQHLEFGVSAFPDEITIDTLSVKNSESSEDQLAYEGPDFADLDENLQKAFHKYLEIRGIKPSTTNFLFDYMTNKDDKEYLQWLNNLKSFVEK